MGRKGAGRAAAARVSRVCRSSWTPDATVCGTSSSTATTRGHVRRLALDAPVWAAPAFGVELSLGALDAAPVAPPGENRASPVRGIGRRPSRGTRPLPTTPASEFDLALLVPDSVRGEQVEAVMRRVSGKLLENVRTIRPLCWSGRRSRASESRVEVDLPPCGAHSTGQGNRSPQLRHPSRPGRRAQCPTTHKLRMRAVRELDTLVRHLADELAGFRRRALVAEARLKEIEEHGGRRAGDSISPLASTQLGAGKRKAAGQARRRPARAPNRCSTA